MIAFCLSVVMWIFAACIGFWVLKLGLAAIGALAGALLAILSGGKRS